MEEIKRLLILGAGFSRAVSTEMNSKMPLMKDLITPLENLLNENGALQHPSKRFLEKPVENPEFFLSYLGWEQPWETPAEVWEDKALFEKAQNKLANFIKNREKNTFEKEVPKWANKLVKYLHDSKTSVITFNYDTILERIIALFSHKPHGWPLTRDLYPIPLSTFTGHVIGAHPAGLTTGEGQKRTFNLIKLHGSINWYYSGGEGFPGERVYYRPVTSRSPCDDFIKEPHAPIEESAMDLLTEGKVSLIIPPVTEKARFYSNRTIQSLWIQARQTLNEADEIFCVGYSLPEADLTTMLFLNSITPPKRVFIINTDTSYHLKERYQKVFPKGETDVRDDFIEEEYAIKEMVEYLSENN